jgi:hypothetical protein
MKKNYYELLGVSSTATPAEIKAAAQLLLQKHHPSKQPGDAQAEARFKQIKAIYATLADPQKRAAYDASLTKTMTGTPSPVKPAETKPATPVSVSSPSSQKAVPTKENAKAIPKQESVAEAISKQDSTKNVSKPENVDSDLLPGERVIYHAKVHWFIYLNPLLVILISAYFGFVDVALLQTYLNLLDFLQDKLAYVKIGLQVMSGVGVWMLLYAVYKHLTTNVRITSKRVLAKTGFSSESNEISHIKFEHLEIKSGLLGKIFGFGAIKMRGTKGRGVGGLKIQASHIASPQTFEKKLMQAIRSGGYEG